MKYTIATITIAAAAFAFSPVQATAEDGLITEVGASETSARKGKFQRKDPPKSASSVPIPTLFAI